MRCPMCGKPVSWKGNPNRPFCSERCKLLDLDNWLSGRYRIGASSVSDDQSPAEERPDPERRRDRD